MSITKRLLSSSALAGGALVVAAAAALFPEFAHAAHLGLAGLALVPLTTTTQDNPQVPSVTAEIYDPDQLIAGRFPLITSQNTTLTGGAALTRGTVLGQITLGTPAVTSGANTGNGTINGATRGASAKLGAYTLKATGSAAATLTDPNGVSLPPVTLDAAYSDAQLSFTWAHGSTPFAAGDTFTITVPAGSGKYQKSVATATDGSQVPAGILADTTDASGGDVLCGIYLTGEFNANALIYDASWSIATLQAPLQAKNIFIRQSVSNAAPS